MEGRGRRSSLLVVVLGTGAMFAPLYVTGASGGLSTAFTSRDGIEYREFTCAPAGKELKFGYTCADVWEAEKIARENAQLGTAAGGQDYHLVGHAFVDELGPGGVPASENPRQHLLLNFFVEGGDRLVSVRVSLDERTVIEVYK